MESIANKRKKFMDYLLKVINTLDPSGENEKLYNQIYGKMSDKEFDKYIREFFEDDKANFYLEVVEFDRDLSIDNIIKCAELMKVPLFERVAMPYLNGDLDNIIATPEPVAVGYLHEKRLPQTVLKKNSGSVDIQKRNPKTGQVVNEDKNARNSDVETFSLIALGANKALAEFMGPRADDMKAKSEMYNLISRDGYVSLEDLTNDPYNKVAINTLDVYFTMQGLRTNMVAPMDLIPEPRNK